jgi:hypothetical protein
MPRDLSVGCAGPDVKELQGLLAFRPPPPVSPD